MNHSTSWQQWLLSGLLVIFLVLLVFVTVRQQQNLPIVALENYSHLELAEMRVLVNSTEFFPERVHFLENRFEAKAGEVRLTRAGAWQFINKSNHWKEFIQNPIAVNMPIRILYNFSSQNQDAGLVLYGRMHSGAGEWWQGIRRLNIAYNSQEQVATFSTYDGQNLHSTNHFNVKVALGESIILALGEGGNNTLGVYNTKGSLLKRVFLFASETEKLPLDLFPDGLIYLGVILPPHSQLTLKKLALYEYQP